MSKEIERKKVLFDLTERCAWGDKSYTLGTMSWYYKNNYKIYVLTDNWNNKNKDYAYDETVEPIDFFKNIVVPTFKCNYYDIPTKTIIGNWNDINFDIVEKYNQPWFKINKNKFEKIDYKLNESLANNENYLKYKDELCKTKNYVIYATWDQKLVNETNLTRVKGHHMTDKLWENILNVVKEIDNFCLKNPNNRIVLVSRKAVDWSDIIKSDFLDLRYTEKTGLTFSQTFDLVVNNTSCLIGNHSSYQIWTLFSKISNKVFFSNPNIISRAIPININDEIILNPENFEMSMLKKEYM